MINTMNIRMQRAGKRLSQSDTAKVLDLSLVAYRQKENNIRPFTLPEAKILADFFEKSIDELFFDNKVHINGTPSRL